MFDFEEEIVSSKKLGKGWKWHKYDDGSGYLESPDGKEYMHYDLYTNEYKFSDNSCYEFFPFDCYYADGVEKSKFNAFDFMENELIEMLYKNDKKTFRER